MADLPARPIPDGFDWFPGRPAPGDPGAAPVPPGPPVGAAPVPPAPSVDAGTVPPEQPPGQGWGPPEQPVDARPASSMPPPGPPPGPPRPNGPAAGGGEPLGPAVTAVLRGPFVARTWRAHLYLALAAPLALAAFVILAVALWFSALLAVTVVGIPVLALTVLASRELAAVHRGLARAVVGTDVATPRRRRPRSPGFFPWLAAGLTEVSGWRAMAYVIVSFPVAVVGAWCVAIGWAVTLMTATYPVWWKLLDPTVTDDEGVVHHTGMTLGEYGYVDTWPEALLVMAAGLVAVFVMPWVARGFAGILRLLVRGLLGPSRLSERVEDLEETRAQAVDSSAATLRRIERDLHDGTQARLVALAMHLDMAKERLAAGTLDEAEVVRARDLLDSAHRNATDAIAELREVTRSIHPPALDKGLDAALATLAARSGVPARLEADIPERPSPAIETIAYFCVAELVTNASRHGNAGRVSIRVTGDHATLRVQVVDDGVGGARLVPGGGLRGLAERVRPVDGRLDVDSPPGGPTVVRVELPLRA